MKSTAQVYPQTNQEQGTFRFTARSYLQVYCQSHLQVYYQSHLQVYCHCQSHLQVYCQSHLQVYYQSHLQVCPWQVTSGGQEQYYFWMKCTAQIYPMFYLPLVTSGDQEQHAVRPCCHWLRVMMTLSFTPSSN